MFATEVLHFLIDAVQTGVSEVNRGEMHRAITDIEDLWRQHDPATAPPLPAAEPAPETTPDQARIAELEAEIAQLRGG